MSLFQTLHLRTSLLLGSLLGLSYGCLISVGPPAEPCDSGVHNQLDDQGECICDIGYDWCNPNDPNDLDCCDNNVGEDEVGTSNGNTTNTSNDTSNDTTATDTGDGDGDTTATDTGDGDGDTGTFPPDTCLPEEEGFYWCTHSEAMGPEGSQLFVCTGGAWVENAGVMDESCGFDGYDFAYGCVDNGTEVIFECGVGSGDACDETSPAFCVDDDQIGYCYQGKETWDSCMTFCQEVGIDGVTYEYGECDDSVPDDVACFCCDSGDQGCPI
ncbi:hypothetical protein ACNOYE_05665 [Nannocystaceae bacterium ST9]